MVYGKDYVPCSVMFETSPAFISGLIEDIEKLGSPELRKFGFVPSHTWLVTDQTTGIEASTEGVAYFSLTKYFNDPACKIVSATLKGITIDTIHQMLSLASVLAKDGLKYDYEGLVGDALESLTGLDNLIPELRKVADPLHTDHRLFCSALVATLISSAPQYAGLQLFKDYTVSKISPLLLFAELPFSEAKIIKEATKKGG